MELHGTVAQHDESGGVVLLDDGRRLTYPLSALQAEIRLLRSGQRVRLRVDGEPPHVRAITLVSLPLREAR